MLWTVKFAMTAWTRLKTKNADDTGKRPATVQPSLLPSGFSMIYILVTLALLTTGHILLLPFFPCTHCGRRRSLLGRFCALDKDICDNCIDIINQEIRDKRSTR